MIRLIFMWMVGVAILGGMSNCVLAQQGGSAAGDLLKGQGAYLKGLGSYNLNTAKAGSINVDSMIRWKSDLRKIQRERWNREAELVAGKQAKKEDVLQKLMERERQLRIAPAIEDVLKGDALNVLVYDLTDPDIKLEDWSSKTVSLPPGTSVKDLIFRFTPQSKQGAGATALSKGVIALSRLDIKGKWPTFMNIPALDSAKSAYENAYLKVRDEILAEKPSLNSLLAMDRTLDALKDKVKEVVPAERDYRAQGLKFVDDLKAATRMFDAGSVDYAKDILNDTKDGDATTVAELVSFMLKYRLQFATSDRSPAATELYPKLYQALQQQTKELGIKVGEVPEDLKLGEELIKNPSCEDALVGGKIPSWISAKGQWVSQSHEKWKEAQNGSKNHFYAGNTPVGELYQDVDLGHFPRSIDAGSLSVVMSWQINSHPQNPPDRCRLIVEFLDETKMQILDKEESRESANTKGWKKLASVKKIPKGTRWARVRLIAIRANPRAKSNDARFDDVSLQLIAK